MDNGYKESQRILAENIKRLRSEIGLSQEGLALAAEVDRTYVSQIERGICNPSLLILCRLSDVLSTEPAKLLSSSVFKGRTTRSAKSI